MKKYWILFTTILALMVMINSQAECKKTYKLSYHKPFADRDTEKFMRIIHVNMDNMSENCSLLENNYEPTLPSAPYHAFTIYRNKLFLYLVEYVDVEETDWFSTSEAIRNGEASCYVTMLIIDLQQPDKKHHTDLYINSESSFKRWAWPQKHLDRFFKKSDVRAILLKFESKKVLTFEEYSDSI